MKIAPTQNRLLALPPTMKTFCDDRGNDILFEASEKQSLPWNELWTRFFKYILTFVRSKRESMDDNCSCRLFDLSKQSTFQGL